MSNANAQRQNLKRIKETTICLKLNITLKQWLLFLVWELVQGVQICKLKGNKKWQIGSLNIAEGSLVVWTMLL